MKKIVSSNYSIWVGGDALSQLETSSYSKVAILVDENTKMYCLEKIPTINHAIIIEIKSGEENKNLKTCNIIWQELTNHEFDRNSLLIN